MLPLSPKLSRRDDGGKTAATRVPNAETRTLETAALAEAVGRAVLAAFSAAT